MKTYTEEEVLGIVKTTVTETANGCLKWIEKETIIVDKATQEELTTTELTVKKDGKSLLQDYVYPLLKNQGIIFNP